MRKSNWIGIRFGRFLRFFTAKLWGRKWKEENTLKVFSMLCFCFHFSWKKTKRLPKQRIFYAFLCDIRCAQNQKRKKIYSISTERIVFVFLLLFRPILLFCYSVSVWKNLLFLILLYILSISLCRFFYSLSFGCCCFFSHP